MQRIPKIHLVTPTLLAVMLFGAYLRYEDFNSWQKRKDIFTYQGEYQMVNTDCYYYLQTAKEISQGTYDTLDEKRWAPSGVERSAIPPLLSVVTWLVSILGGIPLATAAIFIPVVLAVLLAPVVYLWGRGLSLNQPAALTASLFSVISLTYLYRTRIGVLDTDCLNVSLLLLSTYLFFQFGKETTRKRYTYLGLGVLNTAIFFFWWDTAASVVLLSSLFPLMLSGFFYYKTQYAKLKYVLLSLLLVGVLVGYYEQIVDYVTLLSNSTKELFPVIGGVDELMPVDLTDFIKKTTGNGLIFSLAALGFASLVWKQKQHIVFLSIPFFLGLLPFFAGNRFLIFTAPIIALGMGGFIQFMFNLKAYLKPVVAYSLTLLIVFLSINVNYKTITHKYAKPGVFDYMGVLDALEAKTPQHAAIWTNWDIGYQVLYFLGRTTFSDGEITAKGDKLYYTSLPLASEHLSFSANFIKFYSTQSQGIEQVYAVFGSEVKALNFLKLILKEKPGVAKGMLDELLTNQQIPASTRFKTTEDWLAFLYPKPKQEVYVLLHQHMLQTVFWFKQGNLDLNTGETQGMPLYLQLHGLVQEGNTIKNAEMNINTSNGQALYMGSASQSFASITSYTEDTLFVKNYAALTPNTVDNRFVFEWYAPLQFGAAMSKEMAKSAFNQLFLQHKKSPYFIAVDLKTPHYQIWKVAGDVWPVD